jgi:hypothetical protein
MSKFIIAVSFLVISSIYGQTDSTFKFTLPQLKITQLEKNKDVVYEFDNDRNNFLLSDSVLTADPQKYKYAVSLADLKKIMVRDGSYIWKTAGIVGAVGGAFGLAVGAGIYLLFSSVDKRSVAFIPLFGLCGALAGGVIGALIGVGVPYFESYPLTEKDNAKKKEVLKKIFKVYNIKL